MSNTSIQIDSQGYNICQDWLDTWRPTAVCRRRWVSCCTSRLTCSSGCRSGRRTGSVIYTPPSGTSERLVAPAPVIYRLLGFALFCSGSDIGGILPVVQFRILVPFKPVVGNMLYHWYWKLWIYKRIMFCFIRHKIFAWFGKFRRSWNEKRIWMPIREAPKRICILIRNTGKYHKEVIKQ